ncbi:MAG: ribosomal protein S18-alanine N-acetyltransferase [Ruminococcus sp.]|nr:ribosomal protein S18-alanine N-acetyltransferase [Ruminococcus sp.]
MEILRLTAGAPDTLYVELSALDKLCVGAEGWSAESFMSEAEKDNGIVLYITDGDRIAALLSGYTAVGEADITSVAVHPDFRRRGYARALTERFEELLPDDTEDIFLEVRESNAGAIALYEKCGFERLSVRKGFYVSPRENAVVMRKSINSKRKI